MKPRSNVRVPTEFARAIAASPDDDQPRLAYADWLDAAGHADRAELVRVQCELARMPPKPPRCYRLVRGHDFRTCEWCVWSSSHAGTWYRLLDRSMTLSGRHTQMLWGGRSTGEWADLRVELERGCAVLTGTLAAVRRALPYVLERDGFAWPVVTDVAPVSYFNERTQGYALYHTPSWVMPNSSSQRDEVPDDLFVRLRAMDPDRCLLSEYGVVSYMLWPSAAAANHAVSYAVLALALGW